MTIARSGAGMTWRSARLRILLLVMAGTVINYIARNTLGVLAPVLQHDLAITTTQYSYVVGAFQLAYTLMQPIGGILIDRIGLTAGFALFALAWSVAGMAHGAARGWLSLAALRGLLGMAESVAIPAGMKTIGEWFPDRERPIAVGWFNAGTALGAIIAPIIAAEVACTWGWKAAFVLTGALGLPFAAVWYRWYRSPQEARYVTAEERAVISTGQRPVLAQATTLLAIVSTRRFWAIAVPRFLAEPAWQTFNFWIPLYLVRERGMDLGMSPALLTRMSMSAASLAAIWRRWYSAGSISALKDRASR